METNIESNTADERKPNEGNNTDDKQTNTFKKPILVGKIGRFPRKVVNKQSDIANCPIETSKESSQLLKCDIDNSGENKAKVLLDKSSAEQTKENNLPTLYKEPSWSGLPESEGVDYKFEILKNGVIIENLNLMKKPYWIFGRLANCDVVMAHPTISRFHAVLQYKAISSEDRPSGFYIYDLGSTHGTFLNKNRLQPKMYVRIQVGHMLKLGCSTRTYLLTGPEEDAEDETELSITQLKQKRAEELQKREEDMIKAEKEREERLKKEEERGVDWGMGDDADEETDLAENPYAQTNNEELYLEDPKKTLRGFMEREGFEYEYDVTEQGMGQFLCKVVLPLDDVRGRPIVAEALIKGKKKEAVVQCALEACRILDRHGVLRQANHESRKRKSKNWEENDYYDSDDDTFLDRTGTVEKKREKRMQEKVPQQAETYQSLIEKERSLSEKISEIERQIKEATNIASGNSANAEEEDSLESFMKELKQNKPDKHKISKLKSDLSSLKQEHAKVIKLANIAKPTHLPELMPQKEVQSQPGSSGIQGKSKLPLFGKRMKVKIQIPTKPDSKIAEDNEVNEGEEEEEEDENVENKTETVEQIPGDDVEEKFQKLIKNADPDCWPFSEKHQQKLMKITNQLQKLADKEDRMNVDWKLLVAKKHKVMEQLISLSTEEPDPKMENKISSELNNILQELETLTAHKYKMLDKVKKMGTDISMISAEIKEATEQIKKTNADYEKSENAMEVEEPSTSTSTCEETDKKKKKNIRRIQQRQEKAETEKQKGYEVDAQKEDYNMWVPPTDQSGDGRTSLNDKLGY